MFEGILFSLSFPPSSPLAAMARRECENCGTNATYMTVAQACAKKGWYSTDKWLRICSQYDMDSEY